VYPDSDWADNRAVAVEVIQGGLREGDEAAQLPQMKWDLAYRAFAGRLGVNKHQVAARAKGLDRGRILRLATSTDGYEMHNLQCSVFGQITQYRLPHNRIQGEGKRHCLSPFQCSLLRK
jgi:hypothetical protein